MDRYIVQKARVGQFHVIHSNGGMTTVRERPILQWGQKSLVQNVRCKHPGFYTRKGYTRLHDDAYNSGDFDCYGIGNWTSGFIYYSTAFSLKELYREKKTYVQFENRFIECGFDPSGTYPGSILGTSGKVHNTTTVPGPPSFATCNDHFLYATGARRHESMAGKWRKINSFYVCNATSAHPMFPTIGEEYTDIVNDYDNGRAADIPTTSTYANHDCFYICTKTPLDQLYFKISQANISGGTFIPYYWTGPNGWSPLSGSDGTNNLKQTGWWQAGTSQQVDDSARYETEYPRMMYGITGYWYQIRFTSGVLNCEIDYIAYDAENFSPWQNVWNGVETDMIEGFVYDDGEDVYRNYASDSITMGGFATGDKLYLSSERYPLEAIYLDFGSTANTTPCTVVVKYWDGDSYSTLSQWTDGTEGFTKSGWISFKQKDYDSEHKQMFKDTRYQAYWYEISISAGGPVDENITAGSYGMPTFGVLGDDFGKYGNVNGSWKGRALYTFNSFARDIYVSQKNEPRMLNGTDTAILEPGDGRLNATVAIVNFYNEIMVFQEEIGPKGGCVTLFEGYSPETFGKIILSDRIGTFSPRTVAVVDGSKSTATHKDLNAQTQVFWLSAQGVFMSDGKTVTIISDDIQNYFDPREPEYINIKDGRNMWLEFDSTENMIKMGLVSNGGNNTDLYFSYDLDDGQWYKDTYANEVQAFIDMADQWGQKRIQVAMCPRVGVTHQYYMMLMNDGTNDDGAAIDAKMVWEFTQGPYFVDIEEILVRCKVQGPGTEYDFTVEENDVEEDDGTGSMEAENANETMRRNRHLMKAHNTPWITFTIQNNTLDEELYLYDLAVTGDSKEYK